LVPSFGFAEDAPEAAQDAIGADVDAALQSDSAAQTAVETTTAVDAAAGTAIDVAASAAVSAPAPVDPPVLKPITITFSGDLLEVNTSSTPTAITVQDRYGVKKQIAIPSEAKIARGEAPVELASLKAGDKLIVEYTYEVATGKRTAKSISVGESASAADPA
jgi:hypothetical protein